MRSSLQSNELSYYVYRIDDNRFNLANTYYDVISTPPSIVSFASTGGSQQEISPINPQLKVVKENNIMIRSVGKDGFYETR